MTSPDSVVHIVDDDESIRRSLSALLESVGLTARTYGCAQEFLSTDRLDIPGCLVLDVHLPGLSGLDLQQRLTASGDVLPIIFLTGQGDIPMSVWAMKHGAVEFLTKPPKANTLVEAVRHAIDRDRATREELKSLNALRRRYDSLTPREREVMKRVVAGRLNKQIAAEFGTTEVTVKEQRKHVMQKMQTATLLTLALAAKRLGL